MDGDSSRYHRFRRKVCSNQRLSAVQSLYLWEILYKLSLSVPVIFVGFLMSNVSEQQMFEHLQEWKGELGFVVQKRDKLSLSPCPNVILFRYQWSYLYVGCFSQQIVYPTVLVEGRQRNHSYDSVRHTNTFVRLGYCVVW